MSDDIKLPPLPEADYYLAYGKHWPSTDPITTMDGYSGDDMRFFARVAVVADRAERASAAENPKTCTRCGGEMKPGQALESTLVGEPDDLGGVVTVSPGGPGKLVPCMKCAECGWSVTVGESKRTRRDKREPWPDGDDES